jgi:hypothetical protein
LARQDLNLQPAGVPVKYLSNCELPCILIPWCRIQSFSLTKPSSRLATSPGLVAAMVAHFMATDRTFARIGGICLLTNRYEQPTSGSGRLDILV